MIKVDQINIEEFRGIRTLTLDFGGKNFAVAGPNGTGKSGIVDALEFVLSGTISRLTGEGRGDLSVKEHGPHVDCRANPEKARVEAKITIPSLGKSVVIERNVKTPKTLKVTPDSPDVRAVLDEVAKHPEIVLSRREIIKYVLAEPGKRWKEVQALLQLHELESVRERLQKIANAKEKEVKPLESQRDNAVSELRVAMSISAVAAEAVLEAANARRAILGLPTLAKLEGSSFLADGLESQAAAATAPVGKVEAAADMQAALDALARVGAADYVAQNQAAKEAIDHLSGDEAKLAGVERHGMLATALDLFDGASCPVCETPWEADAFRLKVQSLLDHLAVVDGERKQAEALLVPILEGQQDLLEKLRQVARIAPKLTPPIDIGPLVDCGKDLQARVGPLRQFLPLAQTAVALETPTALLGAARKVVEATQKAVLALPEPSDRDAARDFLIRADEKLGTYRKAANRLLAAKREATIARTVFDTFAKEINAELETIYKQVEAQFRDFYRAINADDEGSFEAQLAPSIGKLGFAVNFYGRGNFPPGAYHSEGHQDGMGLCLYLALMKHLLGDEFTFAVLDDVLMSVDAGHRREVCNLLIKEFPNTQFVLTTHDGVWLRHMRSVGLVPQKAGIEFRKWSVETGPAQWKPSYIWAEIDEALGNNEVSIAAGLLRRHLEYLAAELCSDLEAKVVFKGDGRFELGALLPSAIAALKKHLKAAKAAAQSWKNDTDKDQISKDEEALATAYAATEAEQWAVNAAVHYNAWDTMQKEDFLPVVNAFKTLEVAVRCAACDTHLHLTKSGHSAEGVRCRCGARNYSLVSQ